MKIITQEISSSIIHYKKVRLFIKRIDLLNSVVSGNKIYKLKYNLLEARKKKYKTLLTFGGAYSNHIIATACAAKESGFRSIGVIRGEEQLPLNNTLRSSVDFGMKLCYINRSDYRLKNSTSFLENLRKKFGNFYFIPEGGANSFGVYGASEIIGEKDRYDYIFCPVGTGATLSGIINSANFNQNIIGVPVLNDSVNLLKKIKGWVQKEKENWMLINEYMFGGYAKITNDLVNFIYKFYENHQIPLDAVYTAKMMFAIIDLIESGYFKEGSTILAIHTGGLQGNKGINNKYKLYLPCNS